MVANLISVAVLSLQALILLNTQALGRYSHDLCDRRAGRIHQPDLHREDPGRERL